MHFVGVWREGTAGAITSKPCYLKSEDQINFSTAEGESVSLPLQPEDCPNIDGVADDVEFNSITSFAADANGVPHYLVLLRGQGTKIFSYIDGEWIMTDAPE